MENFYKGLSSFWDILSMVDVTSIMHLKNSSDKTIHKLLFIQGKDDQ